MYIVTDKDHKINQVISVGVKPDGDNVYEVDSIDNEILLNIFKYKYINGEFILDNTDNKNNRIEEAKQIKISNMSAICNQVIKQGIDYNGEHYSLTETDQINLIKLSSSAMLNPLAEIFYHADGEMCRSYSAEEIMSIATLGEKYIKFHTTYFNSLKHQIQNMTNIDDVIAVNYGSELYDEYKDSFTQITQNDGFTVKEIIDDYDYEYLLNDTNSKQLQEMIHSIQKRNDQELNNVDPGPDVDPEDIEISEDVDNYVESEVDPNYEEIIGEIPV